MAKDYYQILGVSKTASQDEIRKAYYKLAHQHHPHKGGDEAKMKEINEAYSVLGTPEKRSQYDQFGQTFNQAGGQGGFGGFQDFAQGFGGQNGQGFSFEFGDMGDLFGEFFGGGSRGKRGRKNRGADISAEITIDFKEAAFGVEKTIKLNKDAVCQKCSGEGSEPGSKTITCSTCKGTGQIVRNMGFGIGFPSVCTDCEGTGSKAEKVCSNCRGKGVENATEEIKIKVPAGIDNGQTIRLTGRGMAAPKNGASGDLYIKIGVTPDPRFRRKGFDLYGKAEISFTQAALGDKIDIETIDGKVTLKIPEGTQSGKIFRLKGRGVTVLQGRGRGDQLVEVIVNTPTRLSRRQKELLKELDSNS